MSETSETGSGVVRCATPARFALVASITPGGATAFATASGAYFELRRSVPVFSGIATAMAMMAAAAAAGLGGLLPVEHANLVRPFLHWHLLRRARSRAGKRAFPTTVGCDLRRRILVALDLLAWINSQDTTLEDLRQDDLDRWLDEENSQRRHRVRYFLGWTADRGLSRRLTVPSIPRPEPTNLLDDDERWQLLRRCLTDEALPIQARAAGALILLFALQAQRIRHLTADQLTEKGDDTYLTAGRHPILLPPRLGALLQDLAARPPTRS